MPSRLPRPCRQHGCGALVTGKAGYCAEHLKNEKRARFANSPEKHAANKFYDTAQWKRLRAMHLDAHPACAECDRDGEVVDHIRPILDGGSRVDPSNLQTMCNVCHNRKRQTERRS